MSARDVIVQLVGNTFGSGDEFAEDLLGTLKGHGYVVVELPEPTVDDEWRDPLMDWSVWPRKGYDGDTAIIVDVATAMSPGELRPFAAALLAAADAAEESA